MLLIRQLISTRAHPIEYRRRNELANTSPDCEDTMATLLTHTPASLRSSSPTWSAPSARSHEALRPYLIAGRKERTASVGRTAFIALPKESEDARITGSTRSLDRRLLALNLRGFRQVIGNVGMELASTRIA